MSEKDNVQVTEQWIKAFNAHDIAQVEKYQAPGCLFEAPEFPGPVGPSEEIAYTQGLFQAFSDLHMETEQMIARGDYVVANCTAIGTNDGPLSRPDGQTAPATGRKVAIPCSITFRWADGKRVHNSLYYDQMGMMAQLGLLPGA